MAKATLTQKDIMFWTMRHPNGINHYYLIERAPFEKDGLKKALHKIGMTSDSVFAHLEDAKAEFARYPSGDDSAEAGEAGAEESEAAAETEEVAAE